MNRQEIILKFQEIINQFGKNLLRIKNQESQITSKLYQYNVMISGDELFDTLNKFLIITTEIYIEYIENEWMFMDINKEEFENKYNNLLKEFNSFLNEIYFINLPDIKSIVIKLDFLKSEIFVDKKNINEEVIKNDDSEVKRKVIFHEGNMIPLLSDSCYLTTACMKHYLNKFKDDCYELTVLRWFRDNFVSKEDIKHYYSVAPLIVESIEMEEKKDIIYDYIYDNVVDYCVNQIENGNYENAYLRYKDSILCLENTYAKRKVRKLK